MESEIVKMDRMNLKLALLDNVELEHSSVKMEIVPLLLQSVMVLMIVEIIQMNSIVIKNVLN